MTTYFWKKKQIISLNLQLLSFNRYGFNKKKKSTLSKVTTLERIIKLKMINNISWKYKVTT